MKNGGPAFPVPYGEVTGGWAGGLTKREWFAGMALMGLLANPDQRGIATVCEVKQIPPQEAISARCFDLADAMIAEGERKA